MTTLPSKCVSMNSRHVIKFFGCPLLFFVIKMTAKTVSVSWMEPEGRAVAEIDLLGKEEDEEMELGILKYLDRLEVVTEAFFSRQVHITSRACFH
jgi:hypothetical protein